VLDFATNMILKKNLKNLKRGFAVRWRLEPKNAEDAEKQKERN
jgi:hypothetical protein